MKNILLWDRRFPDRAATRLLVHDDIASAMVRSGVAAAANPAEAGALAAGGPLEGSDLVEIVLQHGLTLRAGRFVVPRSVLQVAMGLGVGAVVPGAIAGAGPAPTPTPTPVPVVSAGAPVSLFDATSEWSNFAAAVQSIDPAAGIGGHGALRVRRPAGTVGGSSIQKIMNGLDAADLGTTVLGVRLEDDYDWQVMQSIESAIQLNSAGGALPLASLVELTSANSPTEPLATGLQWVSGDAGAQPSVPAAGVGNHRRRLTVAAFANGPQCGTRAHVRLYDKVQGKAGLLWRFDDGIREAAEYARAQMKPRNQVGQLFPAVDQIGKDGSYLGWPDYAQFVADGWAVGLTGRGDAGLSDRLDDEPGLTVQQVVGEYNADRQLCVDHGLPPPNALNYAFGGPRVNGPRKRIVSASTSGFELTPTNGSTIDPAIAKDWRVIGEGASYTTKVDRIENGKIILNEAVQTVANLPFDFVDASGEFHGNKLQNALRASGWRYGMTIRSGVTFHQFGHLGDICILMRCEIGTDLTIEKFQGWLNYAIRCKAILVVVIHNINVNTSGTVKNNTLPSVFLQCLDLADTHIAAGRLESLHTGIIDEKYWDAQPPAAT